MAPRLERIAFDDFSAGMVRNTPVTDIPENGAWDIDNFLVRGDGSLYRRGGVVNKSSSAFGTTGLRFLWDGLLGPGARMLSADDEFFMTMDEVVSTAPVTIGERIAAASAMELSSTAVARSGGGTKDPVPMLFIGVKALEDMPPAPPGNTIPQGYIYGGSVKDYNLPPFPNCNITNGSKLLTAGTSWTSAVDPGMLVWFGNERVYTIESVDSSTQVTLSTPYEGTTKVGVLPNISPIYPITVSSPYELAEHYCSVADRLLAASGSVIHYSAVGKPHSFPATNFHELPEGVKVTGLRVLDQDVLVFTTHGVWALQGMAFDAVDADGNPQHRLFPLARDLVLWGALGIAEWEDALVVPCRGGVYLMDGESEPVLLSRSIQPYLDVLMDADMLRPGKAKVYRNHYFLPIPDATVLVCRLDQPTRDGQGHRVYPWTRMSFTHPLHSFAVREQDGGNILFGAQSDSSARIVDCSAFLRPSPDAKLDAGSSLAATVITRAAPTGNGTVNAVRHARVRGKVVADTGENPIMTASYTTDVGTWHETNILAPQPAFTTLTPSLDAQNGEDPVRMRVNEKSRWIQFKVETTGPAVRAYLYSTEAEVRPSEAVRK